MIHPISRCIYCTYSLYDNTLLYTHLLYIYCLFRFPYLNNKRRYIRFLFRKLLQSAHIGVYDIPTYYYLHVDVNGARGLQNMQSDVRWVR